MNRGDVFTVRPPRVHGRTQQGPRLGIVVQANPLLQGSTVIIAPTSTRAAATSWRPRISVGTQSTLVMTDQLVAVDTGRLGEWITTLPVDDLNAVDTAIKRVLGLR